VTRSQQQWVRRYKQLTGFDPCIQDEDFNAGRITFAAYVRANVDWFEDWAQEQVKALRNHPEAG